MQDELSRPVHDIVCRAGETFQRSWLVKRDGSIEDISEWTAWMQVRKKPGAAVLIELQTPDPQDLEVPRGLSVATGQLEALVAAATTQDWTVGHYQYDCLATDPDGVVYTLSEGSFIVRPGVTVAVPVAP